MIETIKEIIAKQLQIDVDIINDDADIFDDLGADSLDVVEMLMAVEIAFGVSVPDDEIINMRTIREIINYIELHCDGDFEYIEDDDGIEDLL